MKKITILLSLVAFVFALASCGGPESDAKKMVKSMEEYTKVANKAAEDQKLDAKEIEELNGISAEMKEIEDKYKDDKEGQEKVEKYFEENEEELKKVIEEFTVAAMNIYGCEGAENLK